MKIGNKCKPYISTASFNKTSVRHPSARYYKTIVLRRLKKPEESFERVLDHLDLWKMGVMSDTQLRLRSWVSRLPLVWKNLVLTLHQDLCVPKSRGLYRRPQKRYWLQRQIRLVLILVTSPSLFHHLFSRASHSRCQWQCTNWHGHFPKEASIYEVYKKMASAAAESLSKQWIFLASTTHSHSTGIVDPPKGVVSGSTAYNPSSNAA